MQPPRAKAFLPRSLLGRALLILLVPIVLLQLVVGLVFFQRHYQRVTDQLTRGVALELNFAVGQVAAAPDAAAAASALAQVSGPLRLMLRLDPPDPGFAPEVRRERLDLTGRVIVRTLEEELERPLRIDLVEDERLVRIATPTDKGVLVAEAPRGRLSVPNPHQLLVLMLGASAVLGTIAVLFLRNQVRPIRQLAEAAEAFGKGRSAPFRPAGAEEVRRAGGAFLNMRARIERQIEQRTMLLSGVSHDLRTPLTRMKLTLALMDEDEETEGMRGDVAQMERMLAEFLAFARGDGAEEPQSVDPFELAAIIVENAGRGGLEVGLSTSGAAGEGVQMRADAVRRAVENLLGNAARYGRRVTLHVRLLPKTVDFVVEDDGPGIPAAQRARALAPFARLDSARNQDTDGNVGLGLTIALDVARGHGGSLELGVSPRLGGLRATLRLPR